MLKLVKNIILVSGALVMCVSCKDFLNTPPKGSMSPDGFYSTPAHVEQGIRGVYSKLNGVEVNQYLLFSEDRSDNVFVEPIPNATRSCSEVSNWRLTYTLGELESLWSGWYSLIYNANMVLGNLESVNFTDEGIKNQFKGELLFLRGYAHFELARSFGDVPIIDHVISSDEAKSIGQSRASEVINNRVIPDLKEAENLLPYKTGMKGAAGGSIASEGRADKIAAEAMLARVYMTLKGYPFNDASAKANAKSYLEKVLSYSTSNGDAYWAPDTDEWNKMWLIDPTFSNKYHIFSIQHRLSTGSLMAMNEGVGVSKEYLSTYTNYTNGTQMTPVYPEGSLWYEYSSNNDKRGLGQFFMDTYAAFGGAEAYGNISFDMNINGTTRNVYICSINTKFLPYDQKRAAYGISFDDSSLNNSGWPLNFPVLRLEDMMLLYAEILVEDGDATGAMKYVNKIRTRAGVPAVPTSPSATDAMNYIKRERKLELYLEGVRWFDQVRYGEWKETTLAKFQRYASYGNISAVATANIKDGRYVLPVPETELNTVPGLYHQTDAWN